MFETIIAVIAAFFAFRVVLALVIGVPLVALVLWANWKHDQEQGCKFHA